MLPLKGHRDIARARGTVLRAAREIALPTLSCTRVATAVSELARNAILHGGGGSVTIRRMTHAGRPALGITIRDHGPGIENLDLAFSDGWTTGSGLGLGLPGARRLVNHIAIDSSPGRGTVVKVVQWC